MRLLHRSVDLNAPKGDDEVEYTPLQLTRLRFSAINFQRVVIAALVLMLAAGVAAIGSARATDRHQCVAANRGRAEIKAAFADLYDGFIAATGNSQQAVDFKRVRMAKLDKALPQRHC